MKILLLGEYSNVHHTLALGLKELGHQVTLVSDGDGWKDYPRDINLKRNSTGPVDTFRYLLQIQKLWPKLKGFDVVQIINPTFLELRAERIWPYYQKLREQNRSVFMGAFGMDHYWAKAGMDGHTFRYSDFNIGTTLRHTEDTKRFIEEWIDGEKGVLNKKIANDCDGIVCGLYEYYASYKAHFHQLGKICFIPFPIVCTNKLMNTEVPNPVRIFIGIQRSRNAYKGTDLMLKALIKLKQLYPQRVEVVKAENVPFAQYCLMMHNCDVMLDQLYSYTPAMNALQAMSQGIVLVGGGEPEHYQLLNETKLFPIQNVQPNTESVFQVLEQLVLHPERIPRLRADSIAYVHKHHNHLDVTEEYLRFWSERLLLKEGKV